MDCVLVKCSDWLVIHLHPFELEHTQPQSLHKCVKIYNRDQCDLKVAKRNSTNLRDFIGRNCGGSRWFYYLHELNFYSTFQNSIKFPGPKNFQSLSQRRR